MSPDHAKIVSDSAQQVEKMKRLNDLKIIKESSFILEDEAYINKLEKDIEGLQRKLQLKDDLNRDLERSKRESRRETYEQMQNHTLYGVDSEALGLALRRLNEALELIEYLKTKSPLVQYHIELHERFKKTPTE